MIHVIISVLVLSLSLMSSVVASQAVDVLKQQIQDVKAQLKQADLTEANRTELKKQKKQLQDELIKASATQKKEETVVVDEGIAADAFGENLEDSELKDVAVVGYNVESSDLGPQALAKTQEIENLLSQVDKDLELFETVLFDRDELSFSEKIAFDRVVQFIKHAQLQCNSSKDAINQQNLFIRHSTVAFGTRLLFAIKETFMRLECLTVGRYEMDESCQGLLMPLLEVEVKRIVLNVACKLIELFENKTNSLTDFFDNLSVEEKHNELRAPISLIFRSCLGNEFLEAIILTCLPEYLQITWTNTLLAGGSEKKRAQQFIKVHFAPEVQIAYSKFLYEFSNARKTGNYEEAKMSLAESQDLIKSSKALCLDKESVEFKVLKIWDFKLRKIAIQLEMSKKAKEFCTTPEKQEILIKHQITSNDVLLRGLVGQDREFAEYFDKYSHLVELYLFSKETSPKLMVELYQLVNQMKRMLEVHAQEEGDDAKWTGIPVDHWVGFNWVKTFAWKAVTLNSNYLKKVITHWFYPPNLKKIYLTDMVARLEEVARVVNKKSADFKDGKPPEPNSLVSNILQGGWAKQNDYGAMLKDFFGQAVSGQAQSLKSNMMQMLGYASPVVVMAVLKYIMPSLSGSIKSSLSDLLASMSNDPQVTQKADSFSQPVKEKVAEFLKNNPGLLDSVKPEQLKDLVIQASAANIAKVA